MSKSDLDKPKSDKKHDPNAETLYGEEAPTSLKNGLEGRVSGIRSLAPENASTKVEKAQEETRFPIYTMLGTSVFSAAVAATAGYMLVNGKNLEKRFFGDSQPQTVETASTSEKVSKVAPETPDFTDNSQPVDKTVPKEIRSSKDLAKVLKHNNIKISSEELEGKSNNPYLEAQRLRVSHDQNQPFEYNWETMLAHKGKIKKFTVFVGENDEDVIIATLNKQPQMGTLTHQGVLPIATSIDETNPLITYHYYKCVPPKTNNIASIALSNQPNKNIAMYSIQLKQCPPKSENP